MRTHSRKSWPLFLAVVAVAAFGIFVVHGVAAGLVLFVAWLGLLGAAIRALAGEKVNDGAGGIAGGTSF
jgi:hypothetical protein